MITDHSVRQRTSSTEEVVNFLPGPVKIGPSVHAAFARTAISHRSAAFDRDLGRCRARLCELTGARRVALLVGSGTLANDLVAGQIKRLKAPGIVLGNGEFGRRLADHAARLRLNFEHLTADWGQPLPYDELLTRLRVNASIGWLWAVHCETSTGVLNDLEALKDLARRHELRLAMDCISSIGAVPVDLNGVHLASGVSGKALASFPGLCMVFHDKDVTGDPTLPRYLDLSAHASVNGVPFTMSSNLVSALAAALERFETNDGNASLSVAAVHRRKIELASQVRRELTALGYRTIAPEEIGSPAVISFVPPAGIESMQLGEYLESRGVLLSYRSRYLIESNVLQVCLMSEHAAADIAALIDCLVTYHADTNSNSR